MIKRLIFKAAFMLSALFAVLLFMPGPGGKPLMSISDLPGYGLFTAANNAVEKASEQVSDMRGDNQIYTWVDENGAIHYSDEPADGSAVHQLSETNDAIPAENFTGAAYAPKKSEPSNGRAFRIPDGPGGKRDSAEKLSTEDFKALADGDFSNASEVLKQLPEYLQQAQQQRTEQLDQLR